MIVGIVYLFILIPVIALIAGGLTVAGTQREAARIRAAESARQQVGGPAND